MNAIHIELPPDLQSELREIGLADETRLSAWVAEAVREKLAASRQLAYLDARAARGNRETFRRALGKVPAVPPADEGRW